MDKFVRHVMTLVSGTVIAQGISLAFSFVLARIYDADDFGYFSAFIGILSILAIAATGSYDKALMFSTTPRRSIALIVLVFLIATAVSILVAVGGILLALFSVSLPFGFDHVDTIILLPAGIILMACLQLFTYRILKDDKTRQLALLKVLQSILTGALQTGGGLTGVKSLVLGYVGGLFLFAPALARSIAGKVAGLRLRLTKRAVLSSAIRYRRYPKYVCPNELLDVIANQLPSLLIGLFFSIATLGQYGFALRILAGPAALLGQAVSQVFFKSITDPGMTERTARRLMIRVWMYMAAIGLLPFSLLCIGGESIFEWVFGSTWSEAGQMAEILAILLFFRFVSSPTSTIYYRLNLQKAQLGYGVLAFVARSAPISLVYCGYEILEVLALQVMGEIIVILAFNLTAMKMLSKSVSSH